MKTSLSFIFLLITSLYILSLNSDDNITISFLIKNTQNGVGAFYYDIGNGLNEDNKVEFNYETNYIKVKIPYKKIKTLRFDPLKNSDEIEISNFKINYQLINLSNLNLKSSHDISKLKILNSTTLFIQSAGHDPYLILAKNIEQKSNSKLLLIFLKSFVILLWLFILIKNKDKILNCEKNINILYWGSGFSIIFYTNVLYLKDINYQHFIEIAMSIVSMISYEIILISFLLIVFYFIRKYLPKFKWLFYSFFYLFFALYYVDYLLYKLQLMHISNLVQMGFDNGFASLFTLIKAAQIEKDLIYKYLFLFILISFIGFFIFYIGERIKKISITIKQILILIVICLIIVFIEQVSSKILKNQQKWQKEQLSYPLYFKIFTPKDYIYKYKIELHLLNVKENYKIKNIKIKKYNIFFFVVESLRNDMINEMTAPNLTKFKKDCIQISTTLSNANATHHAWYAIFNSKYPMYWNNYRNKNSKIGSLPLNILKINGYKINVFSATHLDYFDYEHTIFGTKPLYNYKLKIDIDSTSLRDRFTINELNKYILNNELKNNNLFLTWIDSTHHNYFWPNDFKLKFQPILTKMDYTKTNYTTGEVEKIKNRYRNSLYYVDSLLGKFIKILKSKKLYDNSIIVILGDHGEEFLEHGHLAHSSTLYKEQIGIYANIKFPKNSNMNKKYINLMSEVDILPTIIDFLNYKDKQLFTYLDGKSIFYNKNYILSSGVNGLSLPHLFSIYFEDKKVIFELKNQEIFIKEILDKEDKNIDNIPKSFFNKLKYELLKISFIKKMY